MPKTCELDLLYEELTLDKFYEDAMSPPFQGFGGSPSRWEYFGSYPVSPKYNPKGYRDIVYRNTLGQKHRTTGPAYISKLFDVEVWYFKDKMHNDNGWAYRHGGNFCWFKQGILHNLHGPAVVERGGPLQYWIDGVKLSPKQYKWEIARRKRKGKL